jgi:hypothetical protein
LCGANSLVSNWCGANRLVSNLCGANSLVGNRCGAEDTPQYAVSYEAEKWQDWQNLKGNNPSNLPHILSVFNNNC